MVLTLAIVTKLGIPTLITDPKNSRSFVKSNKFFRHKQPIFYSRTHNMRKNDLSKFIIAEFRIYHIGGLRLVPDPQVGPHLLFSKNTFST